MTELENLQLGQYKLIEAIGHGGMATVYKAYQESLDRYVAVKVLHSNRDPQFAARFKREARAIAAMQHHNILPIYDSGEQNGLLYFVMQYVDTGVTLHDMLGRPIAPIEALRLIGHVLNALEYAHTRGVIHRDIKPANILMPSPTWALLADFGIAKLLNDSQHLTMTGFIIGTAAYMAPEQAAGKPIDARTDLYSLGVVLYEMLTGHVPFNAETPMGMLTMHVYEPPPPPRTFNPDISPLVEALLMRALEKDPNRRYQSAAEMSAELTRVMAHLDRARPTNRITSLYQDGVEAFEQERWDDAAERFQRLVAIDPNYEDATILLRASQAALARASQPAAAVAPINTPLPSQDVAPINAPPLKDKAAAITPSGPERQQANTNQPISQAAAEPTTIIDPALKAAPITDKLGDKARSTDSAPAGGAPLAHDARCPQCGQEVRAEWQACPFCRTPLHQAVAHKQATPASLPPPTTATQTALSKPVWQRWAIIAGVLLLMAGGAGGAWALSRRTASPAVIPPVVAVASATATSAPKAAPTLLSTSTATLQPSATLEPTATLPPATSTSMPTDTPVPTETPRPPDALVAAEQQRLRSGPGQNYVILANYTQGTAFTITGKDVAGEWLQVQAADGQVGWMFAANLQINLNLADIAVVEAPPSPTPPPTRKPTPKPAPKPTAAPVVPTAEPPPPPTAEPPTPEPPTPTPTNKPKPKKPTPIP
jgi:serine/threonine protein kinase